MTASIKFSTSRIAFSGFHTSQKTMASTLTGTVSRLRVDSALTPLTRTRWSTKGLSVSITGTMWNNPGPRRPTYRPRRSNATFSHWRTTLMENKRYTPTATPAMVGPWRRVISLANRPAATHTMHNATATLLIWETLTLGNI